MSNTRLSSRLMSDEEDLKPVVEETLACIDRIHTTLDLPVMPVHFTDVLSPFARYVPGDGKPEQIILSRRGPHKRLSLAHEIGHLLDHALGNYKLYCSEETSSPLAAVIAATNDSTAIKQMRAVADGVQTIESGVNIRQITYWLEPVEVWARAYAQYIAVRSANPAMQRDILIAQNLEHFAIYRYAQWEPEDFERVTKAIDRAFRKLGWQI